MPVNFVRLLPVFLSCLVLAAHFMRAGLQLPMMFCAALVFLLAVPKPWAARLVQWTLVVGTMEWLRTLVQMARMRHAMGEPWGRAALILGVVAILTALSLLVFRNRSIRRRYGLDGADSASLEDPEQRSA